MITCLHAMETIRLPPALGRAHERVYMAQFANVRNGAALKDALIAASKTPENSDERRRMDYAFVDARLILSRQQLLTAVIEALVASERIRGDAPVGFKTPSIHSEILWTLNPNNNVRTALPHADRRCTAPLWRRKRYLDAAPCARRICTSHGTGPCRAGRRNGRARGRRPSHQRHRPPGRRRARERVGGQLVHGLVAGLEEFVQGVQAKRLFWLCTSYATLGRAVGVLGCSHQVPELISPSPRGGTRVHRAFRPPSGRGSRRQRCTPPCARRAA